MDQHAAPLTPAQADGQDQDIVPPQGIWAWVRERINLALYRPQAASGVVVSQLQERVASDLLAISFRQDGILRHNEIVDGHYIDHYLFCLLEEEYEQW